MISHHAAVHVAPTATTRHISDVVPASVPLPGGSGSASPSAEPASSVIQSLCNACRELHIAMPPGRHGRSG